MTAGVGAEARDYVGQWFEIYRRLHEPADIVFQIESEGKIENFFFPHEKGDGVAALHALAEKKAWTIRTAGTATLRRPIGFFRYFVNCILFLRWTRPAPNIWAFNLAKAGPADTTPFFTLSLTREETSVLKKKAEHYRVSLNTLLFYSIDRILQKKFNLEKRSWWMPVNMRPDLQLDTDNAALKKNYVSNFTLDIEPSMKLTDYHKNISSSLKNSKHWATWWWQHLGRYLPEHLIEKIIRRNSRMGRYAGAFSNLGDWVSNDEKSNVTFLVNPLLSHPFGVSVIVWNGKLNLGLRFYPTLSVDAYQLQSLIYEWKNDLVNF